MWITQLEKANEAVDLANIRAAYAEVLSAGLTGDTTSDYNASTNADGIEYTTDATNGNTWTKHLTLTQSQAGWQTSDSVVIGDAEISGTPTGVSKEAVTVTYNAKTSKTTVTIG